MRKDEIETIAVEKNKKNNNRLSYFIG